MRRRRFLGVALSVPLVGAAAGRALGDAAPAGAAVVALEHGAAHESVAATLWGYLDHASSWRETAAGLREYVADGHADAEMFAAVADAIDARLARGGDEPEAVLGFYPGAVLMLHGLRSVREYGTAEMFADQSAFVRNLMGAV